MWITMAVGLIVFVGWRWSSSAYIRRHRENRRRRMSEARPAERRRPQPAEARATQGDRDGLLDGLDWLEAIDELTSESEDAGSDFWGA